MYCTSMIIYLPFALAMMGMIEAIERIVNNLICSKKTTNVSLEYTKSSLTRHLCNRHKRIIVNLRLNRVGKPRVRFQYNKTVIIQQIHTNC